MRHIADHFDGCRRNRSIVRLSGRKLSDLSLFIDGVRLKILKGQNAVIVFSRRRSRIAFGRILFERCRGSGKRHQAGRRQKSQTHNGSSFEHCGFHSCNSSLFLGVRVLE